MHPQTQSALDWLRQHSTTKDKDNLVRFGIHAPDALGVSMANIQRLARQLGRNHELAAGLWDTGCYEARLLTAYVGDPADITRSQMDRWCRDFDNWGVCDTLCFVLFDRTRHAWSRIEPWSSHKDEFSKRAAFALLASLALHDKASPDQPFLDSLTLIEKAATDDRNFVKKGVNWALRSVGRRNPILNAAAVDLARRLAAHAGSAQKWIGKDALREFAKVAAREPKS